MEVLFKMIWLWARAENFSAFLPAWLWFYPPVFFDPATAESGREIIITGFFIKIDFIFVDYFSGFCKDIILIIHTKLG